jgi:MraZ protein
MLLGQFEAKIGEKGRVSLPSKFRHVLGEKLILTYGYENSLIMVSEEGWKALLEGTEGKPLVYNEARQTQRYLLGGASFVELDSKGRLIIPTYLRTFGRIQNEIVFVGLSRYAEIWDKKRWYEYQTDLAKNIDNISQKLIESLPGKKDE